MTIARQQVIREPHVELSDVGIAQSYVFTIPGVLGGSLLFLLISENDPTGPGVTGVSDDVSGAWTLGARLDDPQFGWQVDASVWYLRDATGGAHVVTVDFAVSTDWSFAAIVGAEYAGVAGPFLGIVSHLNVGVGSWTTLPVRSSGSLTVGQRALFVAGFCDFGQQDYFPVGGSLGTTGSNLISGNDSVFAFDTSGYQSGSVDIPPSGSVDPAILTREIPPVAPPAGATYAMRISASNPNSDGAASTVHAHAVSVVGGNEYLLSIDLLGDADGDSSDIEILFLDADGNLLTADSLNPGALSGSTWTSVTQRVLQAPLGAATAYLQLRTLALWNGTEYLNHDMWVTNLLLQEKAYTWDWTPAVLAVHDYDADAVLLDKGVGTIGVAFGTSEQAQVAIDGGNYDVAGFIAAFGVEPPPAPPLPPPPPGRKWQFFDPSNGDTVSFLINPQAGASPGYGKRMTRELTSTGLYDTRIGPVIMFENGDEPVSLAFSGTILDQADYEMFVDWFERDRQVVVIDDLGRRFTVFFKNFKPKRVWSGTVAWRHSYDIELLVLAETDA